MQDFLRAISSTTAVSDDLVAAYLDCPRKAHFRAIGQIASDPELERRENCLHEYFVSQQRARMAESNRPLVFDYHVEVPGIKTIVDAVGFDSAKNDSRALSPVRFVDSIRITKKHRILLAFDAIALAAATGQAPLGGRLVFGERAESQKIKFTDSLMAEAQETTTQVAALAASSRCPELILRKHCHECLFRSHCRDLALATDELSLIGSMSVQERAAERKKGIFTVAQLSHTFRLRRNRKSSTGTVQRRHTALTALAIREQRTYVLGNPFLDVDETPVFLDVEGVPERGSHYLIGMCLSSGDDLSYRYFWADDSSGEMDAGRSFVEALKTLRYPRIVHYGEYEKRFMEGLAKRCELPQSLGEWLNSLIAGSTNVLSILFKHFYFPVYSNSLKEVAGHLGYRWADPTMSGPLSVLRRLQWETSQDAAIKQQLIDYNRDDCQALAVVARKVVNLCSAPDSPESLSVETAARGNQAYHKDFCLTEFAEINKAAYWDHQRNLVYIRTSRRLKDQSKARQKPRLVTPNRTVEPIHPKACVNCGHQKLLRRYKTSRIVYDIKFSRRGVFRDIVRYVDRTLVCQRCGTKIRLRPVSQPSQRYGDGFLAFVVYNLVELCLHQRAIDRTISGLLGFAMKENCARYVKSLAAKKLRVAYDRIQNRILSGALIHADETRIRLKSGEAGYVWVMTNSEEAYFFYQNTRESTKVRELLDGFPGVLVSDFYCGYDAIRCAQQKCLIHLMRDLNDDLLRQPFDEELKELAQAFAILLQGIVRTIDQHGLKRACLQPHLSEVAAFYEFLEARPFRGTSWIHYKERFQRNRDRLFTFLACDGVPWNNNNAEHAIRAFGRLRDVIDGLNGEQSIAEYLVLLSVSVTCKYTGISLLKFLQSGSDDIGAYIAGARGRKRRRVTIGCD